jgi:hypothetical protein
MSSVGDVHTMLAEAEVFLRSSDPMGAIYRAREAVAASPNDDVRQDAELVLARCEEAARVWQRENARRHDDEVTLEVSLLE